MISKFNILTKLSDIEIEYKAYIIDIWGVLWDGVEPYENSTKTLKKLVSLGKPVILLSNAPRRSAVVSKKLHNIGINANYYNKIISSGEICRIKFLNNKEKINKYGNTFYFIGQSLDKTITEDLALKETKNIKEAKFLLVCATRDFSDKLEKYLNELNLGLSLKLPLVCANPDKVVVRKDGKLLICAGIMADYYSSNGGSVYKYGKPFREAYDFCFDYLKSFNSAINIKDILCIGDSLETDIIGANNFGIDSLLIANGIHKDNLNHREKLISKINIKKFFKEKKIFPKYILQNFIF